MCLLAAKKLRFKGALRFFFSNGQSITQTKQQSGFRFRFLGTGKGADAGYTQLEIQ